MIWLFYNSAILCLFCSLGLRVCESYSSLHLNQFLIVWIGHRNVGIDHLSLDDTSLVNVRAMIDWGCDNLHRLINALLLISLGWVTAATCATNSEEAQACQQHDPYYDPQSLSLIHI